MINSNADSKKYIQCFKFMLSTRSAMPACLDFFGTDTILAYAKDWDLVLGKCPRHSKTLRSSPTFYTSRHWKVKRHVKNSWNVTLLRLGRLSRMFYNNIFAGSFHYFKLVSCWILSRENVAGVPRPFDQLPSHVGKVNVFKTPDMSLHFDSDVWGGCLTIIFVGSFPHFKFLTKINSKVR